MDRNKEIRYATEYHEKTKHSEVKLQMFRHYLDWDNRPRAFKVYPDLPSISLPDDIQNPAADALTCIRSIRPSPRESRLDILSLAQMLFFSAGITREMTYDSGTYYMRAASATGALYPIELYVIANDTSGLSAGVYHFCPGDFSLTRLRSGDYRPKLAAMAGGNPDILSQPVTLAFTSLAWRNAWKYQDRSYRHWFWDSGVIAANLLAVAVSAGLNVSMIMGFIDSAVNNLLRLEQRKEAAVVFATIGPSMVRASRQDLRPDHESLPVTATPRFLPLSREETGYPEVWKIHEASSLSTSQQVAEWLNNRTIPTSHKRAGPEEVSPDGHTGQSVGLGDVILRRGSSRRFSRSAISRAQLLTILYSSTRGVPIDFLKEGESLVDVFLIANAVDGLTSGRYFYNRQTNSLKQLDIMNETASRNESGYLCLGQPLFGDASAILFVMTDLDAVLKALGNRGYRACEFEAGVVAGKVYLSSYAQGLGASGSTFYDDAVTESFSHHAKGKSAMIAIGIGTPAYKSRPGKILAARLSRTELVSSS
jgi:SagB-type dehydrogenase family enzyme